jgi:hypothetical protein
MTQVNVKHVRVVEVKGSLTVKDQEVDTLTLDSGYQVTYVSSQNQYMVTTICCA